jgi:hypothetical protein
MPTRFTTLLHSVSYNYLSASFQIGLDHILPSAVGNLSLHFVKGFCTFAQGGTQRL